MLLLLFAAAQAVSGPPISGTERYHHCLETARSDPAGGETEATRWKSAGGGAAAQQCLGIALTNQQRWAGAADEFEGAAREAELHQDPGAGGYWAQAGNAWLAAGDAVNAQHALDAALAAGTLTGLQRGEAHLDRARALVAGGALADARADIDAALQDAGDDPLAWLLSATLARRMNDMARAKTDIAEALKRSPDDASVQREAGNIAAATGDEAGAKAAWREAARLAPGAPAGKAAAAALAQFEGDPAD